MAHSIVSDEQIDFFNQNGYLVIPLASHNLVNVSDISQWTDEVLTWPKTKGKYMIYDEEIAGKKTQPTRTEMVTDYHDGLRQLLKGGTVQRIVHDLTGKDVLLFKDKINYKLPGANGFVAHIDAPAYTHMGEKDFVEVMFAVEPQTEENGCLEVVPGSHKTNVTLANGGRIDQDWEEKTIFKKVPVEAGDMLIFGSVLAHRSGPNHTANRRAAIFGTYHFRLDEPDFREKYYAHRRAYFPPDNEREEGETYEAGWKIYGFSSPFTKTGEKIAQM